MAEGSVLIKNEKNIKCNPNFQAILKSHEYILFIINAQKIKNYFDN